MIKIEEQRDYRFALFHLAFRPFFLGAVAYAFAALLIWGGVYLLGWSIRPYGLPPVMWHAHEMIYGYGLAVIAGFLLTAAKNWTGVQTLHGVSLLCLVILWLAARLLPLFGGVITVEWIALLDLLFVLILLFAVAHPILKVRQWKQLPVLLILLMFLAGNTLFYLGLLNSDSVQVSLAIYAGLYLILAMIFFMGGRVIPFFTQNGVDYPVQLGNQRWLEISSVGLFILFCIADLFVEVAELVALLAVLLAILHSLRMRGWYTPGIWKKPLLWVLFVGYGALIVGFLLKGLSPWLAYLSSLSLHAFTYGGIGIITLGMMARVAYGHSGRDVFNPPRILNLIFLLLLVGALFRVGVPLATVSWFYELWVGLGLLFWLAAFGLFLVVYTPILIKPRPDGKYG